MAIKNAMFPGFHDEIIVLISLSEVISVHPFTTEQAGEYLNKFNAFLSSSTDMFMLI